MNELFIPPAKGKRVVVVGGGFGGMKLVKKLKNSSYQVVLIDKHNYHTFQPLLYQVATGGLEPDSIAYPIRHIFKRQKNFFFRLAKAISIEPENKKLVTDAGELSYDYLVIATGSDSNFFGMQNVKENAMPLKSLTEALNLRSLIFQNFEKALDSKEENEKYLNIVIIGGGPTGVELAGALAELKKHALKRDYPELDINKVNIFLVEGDDKVLASFSKGSSEKTLTFLKNLGVKLKLSTRLKEYDGEKVTLSDGTEIKSECVIWSAGVKGETMEGLKASVGKSNRFDVDEFNRIKNAENIFAVGDVALMSNDSAYSNGHPMVAQVAIQQARNVGENLKRIALGKPLKPFRYSDLGSLATIGRNKAVAEFSFIKLRGIFAWFIWMAVHLMALVGFRNRIVVFINWVWNYFSYDRAIRLIVRPYTKSRES